MELLDLPSELIEYSLHFLNLNSLSNLSRTNKVLNKLTSNQFKFHSLTLSYSPITLAHIHLNWNWSQKCNYTLKVNDKWKEWNGKGEVLGGNNRTWSKCMPVIKLWPQPNGNGRIIIGRNNIIEIWELDELGRTWNSHIDLIYLGQGGKLIRSSRAGMDDITGITLVSTSTNEIIISTVGGRISRFRYEPAKFQRDSARLVETIRYSTSTSTTTSTSTIQSLKSSNNILASINTTRLKLKPISTTDSTHIFPEQQPHSHSIQLQSISTPWVSPTTIPYSTKPCSLLFLEPTTLVVGHTGLQPLSIHTLSQSGEPLPSSSTRHYSATSIKSSIYALTSPHPLSTFLQPTSTIISAYYDSTVKLYDLRTNEDSPSLELLDQFNDDPCYSITSGGPGGNYIVVGTARNSAIRIFDIRFHSTSISSTTSSAITLFSPGKDKSPIYGLEIEFGKIWGVTESRAFGIGFEETQGWGGGGGDFNGNFNNDIEIISYYEHREKGIELKKSKAGR